MTALSVLWPLLWLFFTKVLIDTWMYLEISIISKMKMQIVAQQLQSAFNGAKEILFAFN